VLRKVRVAVIGGTGLGALLKGGEKARIGTPYGPTPPVMTGRVGGVEVAFLPRHGEKHTVPPHRINYRANIWGLRSIGVERVISTNAVGAIEAEMKPCELVVPNDFLDFTRRRLSTFYEDSPVTHIDVTEPYCPTLRSLLLHSADALSEKVWDKAVLVCVEGPRLETPAEIRMFRALGGGIIGMTGLPEAALARELEMCYATICYVSNMAAGIQKEISAEDVAKTSAVAQPKILRILERVIPDIPEERVCPCSRSLEGARL